MQFNVLIPLFFLTAAFCLSVTLYLLRNFHVVSSGCAAFVAFIMTLWSACGAIEMMVTSHEAKLLLTNIGYVAYAFLSPAWALLLYSYVTRRSQNRNPLLISLFVLFGAFIVFNWFNPGNMFYRDTSVENLNGLWVFVAKYGPVFWVYTVCSYACLAATFTVMFVSASRGRVRRKDAVMLMTAGLAPIFLNMLYIFKMISWDLTPLGYLISCTMFFLLYRGEFFAQMPLSRQLLLEAISSGYILLDRNMSVIEINAAARRMLLIEHSEFPERDATEQLRQMDIAFAATGVGSFVKTIEAPNAKKTMYRLSVSQVTHKPRGTKNYMVFMHDETTLHTTQERVAYLEKFDSAGVYNRKYFIQVLDEALETVKATACSLALVHASFPHYRDYCYQYGNEFGGMMVHAACKVIRDTIRAEDCVGRAGTDEIFILYRFESSDIPTRHIELTMQRLYDKLRLPVSIHGTEVDIQMVSGIAFAPHHTDKSGKLISMAHMAKRNIPKTLTYPYAVFQRLTGESYNRSLQLENDLHNALSGGELYLMYQPQIDSRTGRIVGAEALIRWNHPTLGLIVPTDFVPIAEENGLIHSIGLWVIRQTILQLKAWQDMGFTDLKVSCNVSISQLASPTFSDQVIDMAEEAHIDPAYLELELTETLALFPNALSHGHLQKLRQHNIRIAMDDFGMGHTSLSYIREYELDTVKIDRVLAKDIAEDKTSFVMVRSISMLCESLGLDTVVEYIETPAQIEALKELNCYILQGFAFAPPLSAEAATAYLKKRGTPGRPPE